jgi:arylsulfatase A-like enzyme
LENTYVIFTSDNGYHLGQHRMPAGKGTPYEEDINVPFMIRGPQIPTGIRLDGFLAGNVDIAPTLAELAGVEPPATVEGRSLVPLLGAAPPTDLDWRQAFLLEYYPGIETSAVGGKMASPQEQPGILEPGDLDGRASLAPTPAYRGLRTQQYLYVEYLGGFRELYDLREDPLELRNIVEGSDPSLLAALSNLLADLSSCTGADCRAVEVRRIP